MDGELKRREEELGRGIKMEGGGREGRREKKIKANPRVGRNEQCQSTHVFLTYGINRLYFSLSDLHVFVHVMTVDSCTSVFSCAVEAKVYSITPFTEIPPVTTSIAKSAPASEVGTDSAH